MDIEQALNAVKEFTDNDGTFGVALLGRRSDNIIQYQIDGEQEDQAIAMLSVMETEPEFANIVLFAVEEYCSRRGVDIEIPTDIITKDGKDNS